MLTVASTRWGVKRPSLKAPNAPRDTSTKARGPFRWHRWFPKSREGAVAKVSLALTFGRRVLYIRGWAAAATTCLVTQLGGERVGVSMQLWVGMGEKRKEE